MRRWKRDHTRKKLESHLNIVQQARLDTRINASPDETSPSARRLQSLGLGDIGVTLFSPLDGAFDSTSVDSRNGSVVSFEIASDHPSQVADDAAAKQYVDEPDATTADETDEDEDEVFVYEDGTELESPLLLSMDIMKQLRQAMPSSTQLKLWKRLYSLARDGDVFETFLRSVSGHRQTLLVIQTATGEVFGGFAEASWGKLAMRTDGAYHGTGRSFLFSVDTLDRSNNFDGLGLSGSPSTVVLPNNSDSSVDHVTIHPWQGVNEYSILCSTLDGGRLAMGGGALNGSKGASFGFCVEDHFCKGSSGACATFGNKGPLSSTEHYEIVDFEVYGFVHGWCE